MNGGRTDMPAPDVGAPEPRGGRRPFRRWLMPVALVFAAQVGIIFALGERHFKPPRPVTNVPQLRLAAHAGEGFAFDDPTLFALPHANDFAAAVWLQTYPVPLPSFHWTEPARPLLLAVENLGAVFDEFMQTNQAFASHPLDFKPPPRLSAVVAPLPPVFADNSTLRVAGGLAGQRLLAPLMLTNWPYPDVIAPSRVQAVVDAAGNVVSAVLLPPDNLTEAASHFSDADQRALELARAARFAPAPRLTIGLLIFNWRTVPLAETNMP